MLVNTVLGILCIVSGILFIIVRLRNREMKINWNNYFAVRTFLAPFLLIIVGLVLLLGGFKQ